MNPSVSPQLFLGTALRFSRHTRFRAFGNPAPAPAQAPAAQGPRAPQKPPQVYLWNPWEKPG